MQVARHLFLRAVLPATSSSSPSSLRPPGTRAHQADDRPDLSGRVRPRPYLGPRAGHRGGSALLHRAAGQVWCNGGATEQAMQPVEGSRAAWPRLRPCTIFGSRGYMEGFGLFGQKTECIRCELSFGGRGALHRASLFRSSSYPEFHISVDFLFRAVCTPADFGRGFGLLASEDLFPAAYAQHRRSARGFDVWKAHSWQEQLSQISGTIERIKKGLEEALEAWRTSKGAHNKLEAQSKSTSRRFRTPVTGCTKTDAQAQIHPESSGIVETS